MQRSLPASVARLAWNLMMKLLYAEDDAMIGESARDGLRQSGFVVDWVQDGRAAELALETSQYALLLLDLGLPHKDGLTLLRELRQSRKDLPVMVVTARDAVADRVAALNMGADDYLIKPCDLDEMVARIHAVIRRHAGRGSPELCVGTLTLNPMTRRVALKGRPVTLSPKEFSLLAALMHSPGKVLSKQELEENIYGWNEEVASNAIEVHLHNLRRKLGPDVISNVRGVGYKVTESGCDDT
jgi:two-component system response regulator QseB